MEAKSSMVLLADHRSRAQCLQMPYHNQKYQKRSKTHVVLVLGCSLDTPIKVGKDSGPANSGFGSLTNLNHFRLSGERTPKMITYDDCNYVLQSELNLFTIICFT